MSNARRTCSRRNSRRRAKPANVIDKIVEFGLKTFYKEVCLLEQGFIFDEEGKKSVAQALKESEGKVGVRRSRSPGFVRYALGEGIDRPDGDFGGEVAAWPARNSFTGRVD